MFERPKAGQKALLVHLEFPGADFESDRQEFIELARSAGAEIVQEPTEQFWGTKDFAIRDPSGNLVRVDQPPAK